MIELISVIDNFDKSKIVILVNNWICCGFCFKLIVVLLLNCKIVIDGLIRIVNVNVFRKIGMIIFNCV